MAEPTPNPGKEPEEMFKTFKTQQEYDDFCAHLIKKTETSATAKAKKDLEQEIRTQIENEAKMTAEEKLKAEREKMEADFKVERTNFNKDLAKDKLKNAGFEDSEMDVFLDFVTDDKETSLGKIDKICESRKASQEKLKAQWTEELKKNAPQIKIGGNGDDKKIDKNNITIEEMVKLKKDNPDLYNQTFGNN